MLLSGGLVDRCAWKLGVAHSDLLRLPNEILNQVVLVFGENQVFCFVNYVTQISDENFAFVGKSGRR